MKICQAGNRIKKFPKAGAASYTVRGGWWNKSGEVPPSTTCTAPNHIWGCLGCASSVNGAQQQPASRGVCLKSRDHPSVIPHLRSWCWAASACLAAAVGNLKHSDQALHMAAGLLKGCYMWGIQVVCGKEPCPVLSPLPPAQTLSAAMASHASTILWLSEKEPGDCTGP